MLKMNKGLEDQFAKSGSRYQFNLDIIAERYCNASNRREIAYQTLQRKFGDACISSPVVELKDESNTTVCERLNKVSFDYIYVYIWMFWKLYLDLVRTVLLRISSDLY